VGLSRVFLLIRGEVCALYPCDPIQWSAFRVRQIPLIRPLSPKCETKASGLGRFPEALLKRYGINGLFKTRAFLRG